jgi:hypothetical protein
MTRVPSCDVGSQRRSGSGAVPNEGNGPDSELDLGAEPTPEAPRRVGLGWRVVVLVWLCGFGGLFLLEVGAMVWKIGKRALGGQ